MLTAADIPWAPVLGTPLTPRFAFASAMPTAAIWVGHDVRFDDRDLTIEAFAQAGAELRERVDLLEYALANECEESRVYRDISYTAIDMLAKVSYQRDRALFALQQQRPPR